MVGCLHKGCSQKFHYICAVESGMFKKCANDSIHLIPFVYQRSTSMCYNIVRVLVCIYLIQFK